MSQLGSAAFSFAVWVTNFHFLNNMSLYIGNKFLSPWDASKHTLERSVEQLHACSLSLDIGGHNQPCCDRQDVRECMQMNKERTFCEVWVNINLSV